MSSSSVSVSFILRAMSDKNSGKSGAVPVRIDLVDHVLELSLRRVLTEGAHHRPELLRRDRAATVLVEEGECLLELRNLLLRKLVRHCKECKLRSKALEPH